MSASFPTPPSLSPRRPTATETGLPEWDTMVPQIYGTPGLWLLARDKRELKPGLALLLSVGAHVAVVGSILLILFIAQLLGWTIPKMDLSQLKPRDLEFVLVEAPNEKPRDPNTRNRAQQNSRSGGEVIKTLPKVQTNTLRGSKSAKPQPKAPAPSPVQAQPQPAKPTVKPTPRATQPTFRPTPKPAPAGPPKPQKTNKPTSQESPMSPKVTATPKAPSPTPRPAPPRARPKTPPPIALPSPTGDIDLPAGPVLTRSGRSSSRPSGGGGGGGSPNPSQIPSNVSGQPSNSGSPGGGSRNNAGQGGTGSFSQYGSPGGGGGRAGIDAIAEPDFGPYIAEVQRRIKRNWTPPSDSQTRKIVVVFTISRSGALQGIRVQRSSGTPVSDQAAVQAIQASAPFRPLPPQYRGANIDIVFTFDYNVLTGGRIG